MTDPVSSHLDNRFSNPGAEATAWDETLHALERAELFWVTTVRSDGRPHTTPLVAVWSDGALHFSTGVGEQKEINLRNNRRVILMTGFGYDPSHSLVKARQEGLRFVLYKPFRVEQMLDALQNPEPVEGHLAVPFAVKT